jgi:hypothetical protein
MALALMFVLAASAQAARAAGPDGKTEGSTPFVVSGPDAELTDLESYASVNGVDIDTARRETADLVSVSSLQQTLAKKFPEEFAGVWIDHHPYSVTAALRSDASHSSVDEALSRSTTLAPVRLQYVPRSIKDLESIIGSLKDLKMEADFDIDVRTNRVEILTTEASGADVEAQSSKVPKDAVTINVVASLGAPSSNLYGGTGGGSNDWSGCPSGFTVKHRIGGPDGDLEYGFVTAGHCGNTLSYLGHALPFRAECYGGSCDSQWHEDGVFVAQPAFFWKTGQPVRWTTGATSRAAIVIGTTVCHYGPVTGYGCGNLASKSYSPGFIPSGTPTYLLIDPDCNADLSEPGDSGGPVFAGGTAYGTMTGWMGELFCSDKHWAIVDAIDQGLNPLGLSVYLH